MKPSLTLVSPPAPASAPVAKVTVNAVARVSVERTADRYVIARRMGDHHSPARCIAYGALAFSKAEWAELIVEMRRVMTEEKGSK